jgi:thiol-disulfide isomerase/thioredoxin
MLQADRVNHLWRAVLAVLLASNMSLVLAKPTVGEVPPDFLGTTSEGIAQHLADHGGKIVVVSFWASWCGPCLRELPILAGLQQAAGEDKLKVIAVNFHEDRRLFRKLSAKFKAAGAKVTVTEDPDGVISEAYDVHRIPHMFIVGADGRLEFINQGYGEKSLDKIIDQINSLLARYGM